MAKFHINPTTGNPGRCSAADGNCPFGDAHNHYDSPEAARSAYEAQMSESSIGGTLSKATVIEKTKPLAQAFKSSSLAGYYGAGSYEATIQKAKDRASYASNYFADKAAASSSKRGSFLDGNASLASAAVADRTRGALSAAGAIKSDSTRVLAHASAGSNPLVADALAARREERSSGLGISTRGLERFGF